MVRGVKSKLKQNADASHNMKGAHRNTGNRGREWTLEKLSGDLM